MQVGCLHREWNTVHWAVAEVTFAAMTLQEIPMLCPTTSFFKVWP